jgi:hypothetical protein
MQYYSVLPSVTEVSVEGSTASMPGRGRSDSRPGRRETVLQCRANLNMNWSLPLRRSVGRNMFKMQWVYIHKIRFVTETQCCELTLLPPTILCLLASSIRGPSPHAFLLPVTATSESPVQLQVPGEQSNASKTSQMATVIIAEPTGNGASSMWSPKRAAYIRWNSEFSWSPRWTLTQIILCKHHT